MFVISNRDIFTDFVSDQGHKTRNKSNLLPNKCNYTFIQKNAEFSVTKIFNALAFYVINLKNYTYNKYENVQLKKFSSFSTFNLNAFLLKYNKNKNTILKMKYIICNNHIVVVDVILRIFDDINTLVISIFFLKLTIPIEN